MITLLKGEFNQLRSGATLSYIILGLSNIIGLIYTPFMLRMIGPNEFGLYSLVASIISYLTILDFGFSSAIIRFTAKFKALKNERELPSLFGMFLVLYTMIGILSCLAGLVLYLNISNLFGSTMNIEEISRAEIMILLMIFNLSVSFPLSIFGSIIIAYEKFIFQKLIQLSRIILNTITTILLLLWGYKAIMLVVVSTFFNVTTLLLNFYYCRKYLKVRLEFENFNWSMLRETSNYSFYIFLNIIVDRFYWS